MLSHEMREEGATYEDQGGVTGAFREDRSSCTLVRNCQIRLWFQGAGVSHIMILMIHSGRLDDGYVCDLTRRTVDENRPRRDDDISQREWHPEFPSSDGLESYVIQDEERQKRDRSNTLTVPEPAEKRRKRTAKWECGYMMATYLKFDNNSYLLSRYPSSIASWCVTLLHPKIKAWFGSFAQCWP